MPLCVTLSPSCIGTSCHKPAPVQALYLAEHLRLVPVCAMGSPGNSPGHPGSLLKPQLSRWNP